MHFAEKYINLISKSIEKYKFEEAPFELYQPINYIIANGGKRLRPMLTLMAADAFRGDINTAIKPALAIEFFHNFTLIHDDIMDDAPLRRGKPTIHALEGINTGILSGDALLIKSYQFFEDLEPILFKKCIHLFSDTGAKICEGQQMDMNFEKRDDVSFDEYIQMITYKTGVLSATALKIGAFIAECPEQDAEALYLFGIHLGIAFQMMDDYLDVFGNQGDFGKKQAGDICENKKTVLYLTALEKADEKQKKELQNWYSQKDESQEKIDAVSKIFLDTKADEITLKLVQEHHDKAQKYLNQTSLNTEKKEAFLTLTDYLLKRNI